MRYAKMLAALIAVLGLAGARGAGAEEYQISIVQSLTGSVAFIGAPAKDGMLMAIDEINAKQLLGAGNTLKASVDDDAGDRGQAISLIGRYAADPKVLMMVGPTTGAIAVAAANAANDLKFMIYPMANVPEVVKAGPWSWISTQPPQVTIPFIANYAVQTRHVKNCAIVSIQDNEAYVALAKLFGQLVSEAGVKLVSYDGIKLADFDFSALGVKLSGESIDCLLVSAPATMSANIVTQLKQNGLDPSVTIFGHNSFASPDLVKTGGKAVEGVFFIGDWMPGGSNDMGRAFAASFKQRFGREPDNWNATGYSLMFVVANALKNAAKPLTRDTLRDAFAKTHDVPVVVGNGLYSFAEDKMPRYGMNVLTVKGGQIVAAPK